MLDGRLDRRKRHLRIPVVGMETTKRVDHLREAYRRVIAMPRVKEIAEKFGRGPLQHIDVNAGVEQQRRTVERGIPIGKVQLIIRSAVDTLYLLRLELSQARREIKTQDRCPSAPLLRA